MSLLTSLSDRAELLGILLIVVVLLALVVTILAIRQKRFSDRWRVLLRGVEGHSLEALLEEHLRERAQTQQELGALRLRVDRLEEKMETSKRHVGLVRYDAFEDVGGTQSFALALYDDRGSGAVLNSIVGRTDCRVYCKPLVRGRSERSLSQEEERAIREAVSEAPRSIVSQ